jgi:hypothetical protein
MISQPVVAWAGWFADPWWCALIIDQNIVWHLTPHVGTFPGRSVCPRAIYRGQAHPFTSCQNQLWLPRHHGRGQTLDSIHPIFVSNYDSNPNERTVCRQLSGGQGTLTGVVQNPVTSTVVVDARCVYYI